ncbi:MAG: type II toxin-antitoxin system Phd/YefM family antitoxin [Deltaproteobacteria bacterium]|nr:type II toxin-antitoxin system Phd/YefM family antitoxin [Deltaproteobacteria bacterium]
MTLSASRLRGDLHRLLDHVLETGEPLVIERKGRRLRVVADAPRSRLARLPKRPGFVKGDPDDLIHLDWSKEWRP